MSTLITESSRVMAHAFVGEPVKLIAVGDASEYVEVANPANRSMAVGFPSGSVFCFELNLFAKLKTAETNGQNGRDVGRSANVHPTHES